ncbi:hypothetical protein OPW41_17065 [Vibrio europaeus]|uniref:Uncharacterized protein n=1 Tax=Vibrio europaeus TaxID=300876 RepID=A0ABT5GML0_9VIBR|nr:hypothetical protein [Vibrio europaeus]MDC5707619.1 hypothetical protein [Vibrio europaeus]MDC5709865.1 hypothetical protein [Vibrio europaeus]MDC5716658.1 hypothetical protein [Vibrio europaeus]MDC5722721.1 hypothetical protein [Vibrio europaeus]MDC5726978.1 hypothetical protein [Vibrio europaeus]
MRVCRSNSRRKSGENRYGTLDQRYKRTYAVGGMPEKGYPYKDLTFATEEAREAYKRNNPSLLRKLLNLIKGNTNERTKPVRRR